jgi:hypothetical protein
MRKFKRGMIMGYEIKYKELTDYLKTLTKDDFNTSWRNNKNAPMKKGVSISDIIFFKMDKSEITLDTLIDYGTPFLVDALGNDLSILVQTRRKYKLPNGRAVEAKYDRTLIDDCRELYGTSLNGYWIIPDRFLTVKK